MFEWIEVRIETLTKGLALLAFVIYICGYLIISVRSSSFGFVDNDPFKPKIIEAGTTFVLLFSLGSWVAHSQIPKGRLDNALAWGKFGFGLVGYWPAIITIYGLGALLLKFDRIEPTKYQAAETPGRLVLFLLLGGLAMGAAYVQQRRPDLLSKHPVWAALLCVSAFIGLLIFTAMQVFQPSAALELWLLSAGLFGAWCYRTCVTRAFTSGALVSGIAIFLVGFSYYANMVFPHISQMWGGGHPVPIAISICDKGGKPTDLTRARLIDQSDSGLFIQYSSDDVAVFVPKEDVARLCFLERAQPHRVFEILAPSTFAQLRADAGLRGCQP